MPRAGSKRKASESHQDKDGSKVADVKDHLDSPIQEDARKEMKKCGTDLDSKLVTRDDIGIENSPKKKGPVSPKTNSKNKSKKRGPANGQNQNEQKEEEDFFYVECIREMRIDKGKRFFLVKWLGYGEKDNSWEPEENMQGSHLLIAEFMAKFNNLDQKQAELKQEEVKEELPRPVPQVKKLKLDGNDHINANNAVQKLLDTLKKPCNETPADPKLQKNASIVFAERHQNKSTPTIVFGHRQQTTPATTILARTVEQLRSQHSSRLNKQQINNAKQFVQYSNKLNHPQNVLQLVQGHQQRSKLGMKAMRPQPNTIIHNHVFRLWMNNEVHHLYLNVNDLHDELYNVIITEDIEQLSPTYFYGAAECVDGQKYCLVQFDGHDYIDVVPPAQLYKRFPGMENYFSEQFQIKIVT